MSAYSVDLRWDFWEILSFSLPAVNKTINGIAGTWIMVTKLHYIGKRTIALIEAITFRIHKAFQSTRLGIKVLASFQFNSGRIPCTFSSAITRIVIMTRIQSEVIYGNCSSMYTLHCSIQFKSTILRFFLYAAQSIVASTNMLFNSEHFPNDLIDR